MDKYWRNGLVLAFVVAAILLATSAYAGVLQVLGVMKDNGLIYGLLALVIAYIFKVIPNEKIYAAVNASATKLGVVVTLGLSKWKFTAPLWNKTIEPWVVDFIDNTVGAAVQGFIAGLRSDEDGNA